MARKRKHNAISAQLKRLQRAQGGRRWISWLTFVAVLAAFLVLPVVGSDRGAELLAWLRNVPVLGGVLAPQIERRAAELSAVRPSPMRADPPGRVHPRASADALSPPTVLAADRVWDPGPLASAHQRWARDCKLCHTQPFMRVRDEDCLSCHRTVGEHLGTSAQAVHGLTDLRCASCHRDHRGAFGLASQNRHYLAGACATCHARISRVMPASDTEAVSDFSHQHPPFRIQMRTAADSTTLTRVRADGVTPLREPSALKFPHDLHLARKGLDGPSGRVRLGCLDCHEAAPDGFGFQPLSMRGQCQGCHQLKLDSRAASRELPHGSVTDVLSGIAEFYAWLALNRSAASPPSFETPVGMARPGMTPERARSSAPRSQVDVAAQARAAAIELFEKTSCVVCHEVTRRDGKGAAGAPGADLPQWDVASIAPAHRWLPGSVFSHRTHANQDCGDCHQAANSKQASDVLMPAIENCRECHSGVQPVAGKLVSDCALCHGFHIPARLPVAQGKTPLTRGANNDEPTSTGNKHP